MDIREALSVMHSQTDGFYLEIADKMDGIAQAATSTIITPSKKTVEFRSTITLKDQLGASTDGE